MIETGTIVVGRIAISIFFIIIIFLFITIIIRRLEVTPKMTASFMKKILLIVRSEVMMQSFIDDDAINH